MMKLPSNFLDDLQEEEEQQPIQEDVQGFADLPNNVDLIKNPQFKAHFQRVTEVLQHSIPEETIDASHEEYHLILRSNEFCAHVEKEISTVHKSLKDVYQKRFPELEQIILNPIEYVQIVKLIGNFTDLSKISLNHILNHHQVVAVNIAATSTQGTLLNDDDISKIEQLCQDIMTLHEYQSILVGYIESRMKFIAPNVSALVGTQVASKLMAAAGGVDKLANIPACNIQVIGSVKKDMLGFSRAMHNRNAGFFGQVEMVQKAPQNFQTQLIRMLATNVAKAARIDNLKTCPKGTAGEELKKKVLERFAKIQELPPAKLEKPLPVPDETKKTRRGGRRISKQKERLQLTEVRKYTNRLKFGLEAEQEIRNTGIGLGMLSQGIGKVKLHIKKEKQIGLSKKLQSKLNAMKRAYFEYRLHANIGY